MPRKEFKYEMFYRDELQLPHLIGTVSVRDGVVTVMYLRGAVTHFPGLLDNKNSIESLWMRVPANIRKVEPDKVKAFNKFVKEFRGRLVTDRFEFTFQPS